ncbi:MAG: hypothetical protein KBG28_07920 [Kofleriaceae bacterium]|nr:hypothetical protein [Kofleriaceae bacterium]
MPDGAGPDLAPARHIGGWRWLLAWTDRDDARRGRTPRRWLRRGALAAAAAAAVAGLGAEQGAAAARQWWLAGAAGAAAVVMVATAYGIFWRPDTALLARLPISGAALLGAAVARAARRGAVTALTLAIAAAPLVVDADGTPLGAVAAVVVLALAGIAAVVPTVAVAAALLVGSGATRALATSGENAAPPTAWLGLLPGLGAAAVVLAMIAQRDPLLGQSGLLGSPWLVAAAAAAGLALPVLARRGADGLARALREVAVLDRQQLAHLEIDDVRGIEAVLAARLPGPVALVYRKDARIMRRRYPLITLAGLCSWALGLGVALAGPTDPRPWALAWAGWVLVTTWTLAGRLWREPVEVARVATLPIAAAALRAGKRAWLVGWLLVFITPAAAGLLLGAGGVAGWIGASGLVVATAAGWWRAGAGAATIAP